MKRLGLVVALAAAVCAIWYLRPPTTTTAASPEPTPPPPSSATAPSAAAPESKPVAKVTKLSAEERKQLADRIASAQAARAALRAPQPPRLPAADAPAPQATLTKTEIRDAMREVIPHLQHCYERELVDRADYNVKVTANITLTGDPDVGTLIDAEQLTDDATTQPLSARFDDCLRATFMSLALPPLAEGSTLKVRYPFVFRTAE